MICRYLQEKRFSGIDRLQSQAITNTYWNAEGSAIVGFLKIVWILGVTLLIMIPLICYCLQCTVLQYIIVFQCDFYQQNSLPFRFSFTFQTERGKAQ